MHIKELQLRTLDLAATRTFYNEVLGLPIQAQNAGYIAFSVGTTLVGFSEAEAGKPVYHIAFDIPNNKLEAAYDWLKDKAAILPAGQNAVFSEFTNWNARSLYFCDNNGNILELICRLDLDNASNADFGIASLLHVSEMGIVTRDVPGQVQQIREHYGVDIYPKQPAGDHFTVMGDEEGLFIIVSEKREWFPTSVEAGIFPAEIVFTVKEDKPERLKLGDNA